MSYAGAERQFARLIQLPDLDQVVQAAPATVARVNLALNDALAALRGGAPPHMALTFLQRTLYRINRLKLFWYDDLERYTNERSAFLHAVRDQIEADWQAWELKALDVAALRATDVRRALVERARADLAPARSATGRYFAETVGPAGYRRLLEIASLDALVEASQLSRTLGGVGNAVQAMLTRVLVEEYGAGRLARKHSSYFETMLRELDMRTEAEAYFATVPWEVLAAINQSFRLSEQKRHFLQYVGGLVYTAISVPAAFACYRDAAVRLGLPETARAYWELHIREDERHGRWMLHDVALPLVDRYPLHAWELLLGYDQQRLISERAAAAVARATRDADQAAMLRARAA